MASNPTLPINHKSVPSEQDEVGNYMVRLPEIIHLISDDEEETDENKEDNPKSPPSPVSKKDEPKDDDDNALAPGAGGVAQVNNASVADKQTERKTNNTPSPPSPQRSSLPTPQKKDTTEQVVDLFEDHTQKIKEAEFQIAQLNALLEEEERLQLEVTTKLEAKFADLAKLNEITRRQEKLFPSKTNSSML